MSLKTLIQAIGHFFEQLFANTKADFNNLPKEQQDAIIQGVNVSQILKDGYSKGKDYILSQIAEKTGVSTDIATAVVLAIGKDLGVDTGSVDDVINHFADKIEAGITDNNWNALWQDVAQFASSWLATGSLNWVTLSLGVIEFAFQHFVKGVE